MRVLVIIIIWAAAVYSIWCVVKAGVDEDAAREQLRRHLNEVA